MSAAARATSARATGESVEKIGIAASSSGVSMPICPRRRSEKCRRLVWGRSPLCQAQRGDAAAAGPPRAHKAAPTMSGGEDRRNLPGPARGTVAAVPI